MRAKSLQNGNVNWSIIQTCTIITIVLCPYIAVAEINEGSVQRLAVLSSRDVQESGLSDLLTIQMQEWPNIELVERELLQKVFDEMALSTMLGSDEAKNRRKAGALLNADILVLLSLKDFKDVNSVTVVVSDAAYGARLCMSHISFCADELQTVCEGILEVVHAAIIHYRRGLNRIIGVSPFLSKTLVHDYDYLQNAYANLLQNALSSVPGVAAIEVTEARSIGQERELTGIAEIGRVVPVFVDGEFKVQSSGEKKETQVDITIRISDSESVLKNIEREKLGLDEAGAFISETLTNEILSLSGRSEIKVLNKEWQINSLVKNADTFARVGYWENSTALREATVLLQPNSVEQRIKLIDEYCKIQMTLKKVKYSWQQTISAELYRAFEHLEYITRNQLVSFDTAMELSGKCLGSLPWASTAYPVPNEPTDAERFKKDFLRTIFPKILELQQVSDDCIQS